MSGPGHLKSDRSGYYRRENILYRIKESQKQLSKKKKIREHNKSFLYWLPVLFSYILSLLYCWFNGKNLINSDAAAEMILADHLNKSSGIFHRFISREWFYSSEIRVVNTQIVYRLGLTLFPDNWHAARTFSVGIFLLILIVLSVFLIKAAGLDDRYLLWTCTLTLPFGRWYGWNVIYNSYYVPHIAITIFTLALFALLIRNEWFVKKDIGLILLTALTGFAASLGGIRQLMICYIPIFLVAFCNLLGKIECLLRGLERSENKYDWRRIFHMFFPFGKVEQNMQGFLEWFCPSDRFACEKPERFPTDLHEMHRAAKLFLMSILVCLSAAAGLWVNGHYLHEKCYFLDYGKTEAHEFSLTQLLTCLQELVQSFGWQKDVLYMSVQGMGNMFSLIVALLLLFLLGRAVKRRCSLPFGIRFLIDFSLALVAGNLFIFITTKSYNESYWVPVLPFLILSGMISLYELSSRVHRRAGAVLIAFWLFTSSVLTMQSPYIDWVPNDLAIQKPAEWLEDHQYNQGYATFWDSDIITELSDGKIEMWTIGQGGDLDGIMEWLQVVSHRDNPPEGRFFILYSNSLFSTLSEENNYSEQIVYQDDNYVILSYESMNQYHQLVHVISGSEEQSVENVTEEEQTDS